MMIGAQRVADSADEGIRRAARRQPDSRGSTREMPGGQTREEWKGMAETNKILGLHPPVPIDGICVRVGTMRCHSQGLCIKLTQEVPLSEIEQMFGQL